MTVNVLRTNQRLTWAAGLTLLALAGTQAIAADAERSPKTVPADTDLDTVRQRILESLLASVPEKTARRLLETLRPDGSWPDIDYQDGSRSGWKTARAARFTSATVTAAIPFWNFSR